MDDIPAEVRAFITANLESIDQLRILILFQSDPQQERDASSLSGQLYLRPNVAQTELGKLEARGFLTSSGEPRHYRYRPAPRC